MTKGIHLNRDTKDLIMLVIDEQKKVVKYMHRGFRNGITLNTIQSE